MEKAGRTELQQCEPGFSVCLSLSQQLQLAAPFGTLSYVTHEALVLVLSSHVAGIQAGGAPFALEISNKIRPPFFPPFPHSPRQDMGVDLQSRMTQRKGQTECGKEEG